MPALGRGTPPGDINLLAIFLYPKKQADTKTFIYYF